MTLHTDLLLLTAAAAVVRFFFLMIEHAAVDELCNVAYITSLILRTSAINRNKKY